MIYVIQEGVEYNKELNEKFSIYKNAFIKEKSDINDTEEILKSNFVGFISNKDDLLFSFPKYFFKEKDLNNVKNLDLEKNIGILIELLKQYDTTFGTNNLEDAIENNLPIKSIMQIVDYYRKYGLYHDFEKKSKESNSGKINWKKTLNSKNYIVNNYNVLYTPYIVDVKKNKNTFITESMIYVLNSIVDNMGFLFKGLSKISIYIDENKFKNQEFLLKKLKQMKLKEFKDINKNLINNIIEYFKWIARKDKNVFFITTKYQYLWEKIVKKYLDYNLSKLNLGLASETNKKLENKKLNFYKKTFNIGEYEYGNRSIEIDHFYKMDNYCFAFDSKYYIEIKDLNYKQVAYYYFLKEIYKECTIVSALILPTAESFHKRIHIDRKDIDGLVIIEYYFNCKELIEFYLDM